MGRGVGGKVEGYFRRRGYLAEGRSKDRKDRMESGWKTEERRGTEMS